MWHESLDIVVNSDRFSVAFACSEYFMKWCFGKHMLFHRIPGLFGVGCRPKHGVPKCGEKYKRAGRWLGDWKIPSRKTVKHSVFEQCDNALHWKMVRVDSNTPKHTMIKKQVGPGIPLASSKLGPNASLYVIFHNPELKTQDLSEGAICWCFHPFLRHISSHPGRGGSSLAAPWSSAERSAVLLRVTRKDTLKSLEPKCQRVPRPRVHRVPSIGSDPAWLWCATGKMWSSSWKVWVSNHSKPTLTCLGYHV